jgi:hypothetical protein
LLVGDSIVHCKMRPPRRLQSTVTNKDFPPPQLRRATRTQTQTYKHTHTHTRTQIHTHTHTHTHRQ